MASFALGSGIPYELSLPQNSDFQDLTLESFKSRVGVDSALLSSSRCDGVQEFQLFTESSQPNPEKNSFRVSSDDDRSMRSSAAPFV